MNMGGIQRQLINLVSKINKKKYDPYVISFYEGGLLEKELIKSNTHYKSLNKNKLSNFSFLIKFLKVVHDIRPEIIYSFFLYINLITTFFKFFRFNSKIVWGIRGLYNPPKDIVSFIKIHFNLILSKIVPDLIIANSIAGKNSFANQGMQRSKIEVIWNGVNTKKFNSNLLSRKSFRNEMNYDPDQIIIGIVGRLHIDKNIDIFISAAEKLFQKNSKCRFLIVGDGDDNLKNKLKQKISMLNINDIVKVLPSSNEIVKIYNGIDVITSVSKTEGLQNSLLEALACNKYCVSSHVGDSEFIVTDKSFLFAPYNDIGALIKAWLKVIKLIDKNSEYNGRDHILKNFSTDIMVKKHENCFFQLINKS